MQNARKKIEIAILGLLSLALAGIIGYQQQWFFSPVKEEPQEMPKLQLTLFVPAKPSRLEKKTIEIEGKPSERGSAELILKELKKGGYLPEKLVLYDMIAGKEGTLYLNFSRDLVEEKRGGLREITTTYALVNSFLINFRKSGRVQMLVDGKPLYTFQGLLYSYMPFEFNKDLLED
jgi:hypothetical protein